MIDRKTRCMIRNNKFSADGRSALGYGIRAGWWPCLEAPYVQLAFHRWRVELWWGLPSYAAPQPPGLDLLADGIPRHE
jgi:hypothetical protein